MAPQSRRDQLMAKGGMWSAKTPSLHSFSTPSASLSRPKYTLDVPTHLRRRLKEPRSSRSTPSLATAVEDIPSDPPASDEAELNVPDPLFESSKPLLATESPEDKPSFALSYTTPSFQFTLTPFMQNCVLNTVAWAYTGPNVELRLLIANSTAPLLGNLGSQVSLLAEVDASSESFSWIPIGYTAGYYVYQTFGLPSEAQSLPFFIDGSTAACSGNASALPPAVPPASSTMYQLSGSPTSTSSASTPSASPVSSEARDAQPSSNKHAAVIAGGVIAAIAALILLGLAIFCFRTPPCRRRPPASSSKTRGKMPYPTARWLGLSSSSNSLDTQLPVALPEPEKPRLSQIEMPRPALGRLEPNRRPPSSYTPSPISTSVAQVSSTASLPRRGDSPTSVAPSYKTRKPVPPLEIGDSVDGWTAEQNGGDAGGFERDFTSPVPSSATSKMYRTRDSGVSAAVQTPASAVGTEVQWKARASSVIDPQILGAMKTMHYVVPDVPPLPVN
ncbi:hypothetical protein C8Q77DRAFT_649288 [Trametes polyzona]|nr:hypothetical protein C8Q77DRAFT_649288 [Trametes polyzona]